MENRQNNPSQPTYTEFLKETWQALDKKKLATIGGIVAALSTLVVVGRRTGIPWHLEHKQ